MKDIIRTINRPWKLTCLALLAALSACIREPELHLPDDGAPIEWTLPFINLHLDVYWDYDTPYGWRTEWIYGWDTEDQRIFGDIGYTNPEEFNVRRYFTHNTPYASHTSVVSHTIKDTVLYSMFDFGYWDILVWGATKPIGDDAPALNTDEKIEAVSAFTNPTIRTARYQAPRYTRAFHQPEQLFAAYDQGIHISETLEGFEYDSLRNVYVKRLDMLLEPITYIYLTQVIIHNNKNKIIGVDGTADFSAFARETNINSGVTVDDPITVAYSTRFKPHIAVPSSGEDVAVAGGRLVTFGICGQNPNRIYKYSEVKDQYKHYMDVNLQFNNGMDSTFVFDVTEKVKQRWKGGVITVELDMDTIPVPRRGGGSAFNAVVKDYEDGGTWEFPM